jgi:UDP-N-acetylglucosamine 2-epimerase (non-hydrolysing)
MSKIKIINVVGARPNFMKIAPIMRAMGKSRLFEPVLLHTGQHYDQKMSESFFKDLDIPEPNISLGVGSGSHAQQTARIMTAFEKVLIKEKPNLVLVVGDVNSTLACSIVSAKLKMPVAHVEAGLRSYDRKMPEEINRIVTDSLSDYLFTTCEDANQNLAKEGISKDKVFFVGNTMIDTLEHLLDKVKEGEYWKRFKKPYLLLTLHRPSNVDREDDLSKIVTTLGELQKRVKILFSVHPRTRKNIEKTGINKTIAKMPGLILLDPLPYLDFMNLMINAEIVVTDSGGIQEETTYLGIPCLTLRENTERPVTIKEGTNVLVGTDPEKLLSEAFSIMENKNKSGKIPKLWDGNSAERIVQILGQKLR